MPKTIRHILNYIGEPGFSCEVCASLGHHWHDTRDIESRSLDDAEWGKAPRKPKWWNDEEYGEFMPKDAGWGENDASFGPWMIVTHLEVELIFQVAQVGVPQDWTHNIKLKPLMEAV